MKVAIGAGRTRFIETKAITLVKCVNPTDHPNEQVFEIYIDGQRDPVRLDADQYEKLDAQLNKEDALRDIRVERERTGITTY